MLALPYDDWVDPQRASLVDSRLSGVGLVIAGKNHQDLIGMGTAFVCAPNLALTARHVIDEIFEKFVGCPPQEARGELDFGVQFSLFDSSANKIAFDVVGYGLSPTIDVGALVIVPENEDRALSWPALELSASYSGW